MTCVQGPGQYSIYGMGHRICFQPPGVGFHHCKQMVFALVGFWDSDRVNMPGHLIFRLQPLSSIPNCLAGLIASCVTFTNNLSGSVCGQDHPGITRPSLMSHNFFEGVMGPPSQKLFTLMVPNQVHLSHTRLNSQTHLLVVSVVQPMGKCASMWHTFTTGFPSQYLATMQQHSWVYVCTASYSASIMAVTIHQSI